MFQVTIKRITNYLVSVFLVLMSVGNVSAQIVSGSFTDSRDGKKYRTVKIGSQTWMAENLNYSVKGSECYDNNPENCNKYGRLYDWATAMKICPAGWHLPTIQEWSNLDKSIGGGGQKTECEPETDNCIQFFTKGNVLKSQSGWSSDGVPGNGTDKYGFSALPGGLSALPGGDYRDPGFYGIGWLEQWWSATKVSDDMYGDIIYILSIRWNSDKLQIADSDFKEDNGGRLICVRCVKD